MPIQRKNIVTGEMEYLNKSKDPIFSVQQEIALLWYELMMGGM